MDITMSEISSMIKLWHVLIFIFIMLILSGICAYREAKKTREASLKEYKSRNLNDVNDIDAKIIQELKKKGIR